MGTGDREGRPVVDTAVALEADRLLVAVDGLALGIGHDNTERGLYGVARGIDYACLNPDLGAAVADKGRRDMEAVHAISLGREIDGGHAQEVYGIVEPIVLVEIRGYGDEVRILVIVGGDGNLIGPASHQAVQWYDKGGVASHMVGCQTPVDIDRSLLCCALHQEVDRAGGICWGEDNVTTVVGLATVVVGGVSVNSVAGVGHLDALPRGAVKAEVPLGQELGQRGRH